MYGDLFAAPKRPPPGRPASTPYVDLTRAEWSALRDKTPLPSPPRRSRSCDGFGDVIDLDEVRDIYLPLSRLLNLYIGATAGLEKPSTPSSVTPATATQPGTPFVIGVAGSVAVGKSTVARVLQAMLSRWPEHPRVELVTTNGFLFPSRNSTPRPDVAERIPRVVRPQGPDPLRRRHQGRQREAPRRSTPT